MVLTLFALPLLLMSIIYLRIFIIISRHQKGRQLNHERSTLTRGLLNAAGSVGTAAAVNIPQLLANPDSTRCAVCAAKMLYDDGEPTISILSEETVEDDANMSLVERSVCNDEAQAMRGHDRSERIGAYKALKCSISTWSQSSLSRGSSIGMPRIKLGESFETRVANDGSSSNSGSIRNASLSSDGRRSILRQARLESHDAEKLTSKREITVAGDSTNGCHIGPNVPLSTRDIRSKIDSNQGKSNQHVESNNDKCLLDEQDEHEGCVKLMPKKEEESLSSFTLPTKPIIACKKRASSERVEEEAEVPDRDFVEPKTLMEPSSVGQVRPAKSSIDLATTILMTTTPNSSTPSTERASSAGIKDRDGFSIGRDSRSNGRRLKRRRTSSYKNTSTIEPRAGLKAQFSLGAMNQSQTREAQLLCPTSDGARMNSRLNKRALYPRELSLDEQGQFSRANLNQADSASTTKCTCDNKLGRPKAKLSRANTIGDNVRSIANSATSKIMLTKSSRQKSSISSSETGTDSFGQKGFQQITKTQSHRLERSPTIISGAPDVQTDFRSNTAANNHSAATTSLTTSFSTYEAQRRHIHASAVPQTNTKALITTLLILGTYFISYVPAIIYQVLTCIDSCPYPLYTISFSRRVLLGAMTTLLLIAKSIIDPFIYSYRMSEIQVAVNRYLSKRRSKSSMANSMQNTSQRLNANLLQGSINNNNIVGPTNPNALNSTQAAVSSSKILKQNGGDQMIDPSTAGMSSLVNSTNKSRRQTLPEVNAEQLTPKVVDGGVAIQVPSRRQQESDTQTEEEMVEFVRKVDNSDKTLVTTKDHDDVGSDGQKVIKFSSDTAKYEQTNPNSAICSNEITNTADNPANLKSQPENPVVHIRPFHGAEVF